MGNSSRPSTGLSPACVWLLRIVVGLTVIMVLVTSALSFVRASTNSMFFLLGVNVLISSFITGFTSWMYQAGHMSLNSHWFLLLAGLAVIWQCIATDVYIFSLPQLKSTNDTDIDIDIYNISVDWTTTIDELLTTTVEDA